jgi:hypothetical protein
MRIVEREEHRANAECPIDESSESRSKTTFERTRQSLKQVCPISVTVGGSEIDENNGQFSNASRPILESFEPSSNAIE